jgi:hypothetical protein
VSKVTQSRKLLNITIIIVWNMGDNVEIKMLIAKDTQNIQKCFKHNFQVSYYLYHSEGTKI